MTWKELKQEVESKAIAVGVTADHITVMIQIQTGVFDGEESDILSTSLTLPDKLYLEGSTQS